MNNIDWKPSENVYIYDTACVEKKKKFTIYLVSVRGGVQKQVRFYIQHISIIRMCRAWISVFGTCRRELLEILSRLYYSGRGVQRDARRIPNKPVSKYYARHIYHFGRRREKKIKQKNGSGVGYEGENSAREDEYTRKNRGGKKQVSHFDGGGSALCQRCVSENKYNIYERETDIVETEETKRDARAGHDLLTKYKTEKNNII